jgi:hypothetical protein
MEGYGSGIGYSFERAVIDGDRIYAASLNRGVLIYKVDFAGKKLQL